MVAKSYQKCPTVGEPFEQNKRMYIIVKTATGEKTVRWYTETQYRKLYPNEPIQSTVDDARKRFGFIETDRGDCIFLLRGEQKAIDELTDKYRHFARYCDAWGWYVGAWCKDYDKTLAAEVKAAYRANGIRLYRLFYKDIANSDMSIKPWKIIKPFIARCFPFN